MNVNPLTLNDLSIAFKSAIKLIIIKKSIYVPLACALAVVGYAISSIYSIIFLAPIFAVVFPFLVMIVAIFMDNNRRFSVKEISEGLLIISLGFLPVLIVLTLIFFAMVFQPEAFTAVLCGIASTLGPGEFLCEGDSGVWDTDRVARTAFAGCIVLSMFSIAMFSTLEVAYLRLKHGLKRDQAIDRFIRQQGLANPFVEGLISMPLFIGYIFLVFSPALGIVAFIHSFTYLYFVYKAKYEGNPNTSAVNSTAKSSAQKLA